MNVAFTRTRSTTAAPLRGAATGSCADEMLITRIAGGDQLAMRTLFARYQVPLYRWIVRIVESNTLAEDLVSDVFLDVWRQAAAFQGRSSVSTWLMSIARFKALSARRRRTEAPFDPSALEIADPADDPEIVLQKKDKGEVVRTCLAELSSEHREVLDLVYYHGKSVKEVAEIVGIAEATAKTRMFYARRKLSKLLDVRSFA
jgi:RNA polymerase sigma-70 factor (ECF subfamily)